MASDANGPPLTNVHGLLHALAFGLQKKGDESAGEDIQHGLLYPLQVGKVPTSKDCKSLDASASDPLLVQARLTFARMVNFLVRKADVHALVRAQAWALVQVTQSSESAMDELSELTAVTRAHWNMVFETLREKRKALHEEEAA